MPILLGGLGMDIRGGEEEILLRLSAAELGGNDIRIRGNEAALVGRIRELFVGTVAKAGKELRCLFDTEGVGGPETDPVPLEVGVVSTLAQPGGGRAHDPACRVPVCSRSLIPD